MRFRVLISGFGTVGRSLVRLLLDKKDLLSRRDYELSVVGVVDSKGCALKEGGFSLRELQAMLELPRSGVSTFERYGYPGYTTVDALEALTPDILVEVTPSEYSLYSPALRHVEKALELGVHVVLANKAPLALMFRDIMMKAKKRDLQVKYKATVMAGTPVLDMIIYGLNVQAVCEVRGILNGTTNYILTLMHSKNMGFKEALRIAQEMGIAEADPSLDIEGWDPAAKLVILVNTITGGNLTVYDVEREPLWPGIESLMKSINMENAVIKYLCFAKIEDGKAEVLKVKPVALAPDDPLASVHKTYNGLLIRTEPDNEIFVRGKGAGGEETAFAILSDILQIVDASR